jgi:hypothetical protein
MKAKFFTPLNRYKGYMMKQKVRVEYRQPLMAVLVAVYKMQSVCIPASEVKPEGI